MDRVLSRVGFQSLVSIVALTLGVSTAIAADRPTSDEAAAKMTKKPAQEGKSGMAGHTMMNMPGHTMPMSHTMMNMGGDDAKMDGMDMSSGMMMNMGSPAEFSKDFNWKITPKAPLTANHPVPLLFDITWKKDGKPLTDLELMHEKPCHLVVLSKDLQVFQHIHPEIIGAGKMRITTQFPKDGEYLLVLQYMVRNKGDYTLVAPLKIGSATTPLAKLTDNASQVRNVEPMSIIGNDGTALSNSAQPGHGPYQFKIIGRRPVAGSQGFLTAELMKDGKPLDNIQTFLGASGHGVMMSDDLTQFLHLHPQVNKVFAPSYTSPIAFFISNIKKPGVYRTWLQFKVDGKMLVGCWDVKVSQ